MLLPNGYFHKKQLGKKECESENFVKALTFYKNQGLSFEEVLERIEAQYFVGRMYEGVLEILFENSK